ncbi:MAG TPA: hypothetical protein VLA36_07945 [Longimicrobiales bacterium]|nr:hypothetical protein [Longimicrobiales bacterium]
MTTDDGHGVAVAEVEDGPGKALRKYERGIPFREALAATVLRFLPGALVTMAGGVVLMGGSLLRPDVLAIIAGGAGLLSLGFGAGLEIVRRWLYPDAGIMGRRSVVAGLVSPLGAFVAGVLAGPMVATSVLGLLFLPALVIAVVMFFAWLEPTPEEKRGSEFEGSLTGDR